MPISRGIPAHFLKMLLLMLPLRLLFSSFQNANFQGNLCPFFKDAAAYAAAAAAFFFVLFKMPLLLL
jgi:hypothetical protein